MLDEPKTRQFDEPNDYVEMHGEKYCGAVRDGGTSYPHHCMHNSGEDFVCCWCGDVFTGHDKFEEHGDNFHQLTPREVEVAALIAEGLSNKQIAGRLKMADHTAKFHVRNAIKKLGHSTRSGGAAEAVRRGIVR